MDRLQSLGLIIVLGLVLPGLALAQKGPPVKPFSGKWWRLPEYAGQMNLTPEVIDKLDAMYLESQSRMIDARAAMSKAKLILDDLLEKERIDETAVYNQVDAVNAALAAVNKERYRFLVEVRKLLGVKGYQTLKNLFRLHRKRVFKRGGGGGLIETPPQD